jgi:hypothetical protein
MKLGVKMAQRPNSGYFLPHQVGFFRKSFSDFCEKTPCPAEKSRAVGHPANF